MKLCEQKMCTGCMACYNVCPNSAIRFISDNEGFLYPKVNELQCIKCGKCARVCPQLAVESKKNTFEKKVYSAWLKNREVRRKSTSGGAFSALAKPFLRNKCVVYGVGFDDSKRVVHKRITKRTELKELRGAKYVQSYIGSSFLSVKKDLEAGRRVLFSGTPCQVGGLYSFLGKRHEGSLFTIDLVCHGVPSPLVYEKYLENLEKKYGSKVDKINFREKTPGWYVYSMRVLFSNGSDYQKTTYEDPYHRGFLRNLYLRPSCYECKYANTNRVADITLADFWGYRSKNDKYFDDDKGISMVMINSENGEQLFEKAKEGLIIEKRTVEEAVSGNPALSKAFLPAENRERFWKDFYECSFDELVEKYLFSEEEPQWLELRKREIVLHHLSCKEKKKEMIRHIPNRVMRRALGEKRYTKLKKMIMK